MHPMCTSGRFRVAVCGCLPSVWVRNELAALGEVTWRVPRVEFTWPPASTIRVSLRMDSLSSSNFQLRVS